MGSLPAGTVTFLYTDIEGSTRRWEAQPEAMKAAVERHDALIRAAIAAHGGTVFRTMGDAFCAVFLTAPAAVDAVLEAQRAIFGADWGELQAPLRVRMALHTGVGEERDGDYVGAHLNRIARLLASGAGGQILLSQASADLVRDSLPAGVQLRDLGQHQLKDLQRPEHIFQLLAPGLPAEFPLLKTLAAHPGNLPAQRSPIVGREADAAAVGDLLLRDDIGLLTLTGPGGTGKTRLGIHVSTTIAGHFEDGAFMVALAPVDEPAMVVTAIMRALDVPEISGRTQLELLRDHLRQKSLLLFLDNFEQVIPAAPVVSTLLAAAPRLKILVTSREALHIYGEHEYPLAPLNVPDLAQGGQTAMQLAGYAAVRLFVERARLVRPDFALNDDNAAAVAEICVRLDGLPLAIELAAARIRLLTPQAMLARLGGTLQGRLQLLTGGARDLPARQQTIRGAIEWSYDLLSGEERTLFNRLGVFRGGCTLAAAEEICNAPGEPLLDVLSGLESLVAKSLLRQSEGSDGEPRFWLLETIREYSMERLEVCAEAVTMRVAHAEYYVALAEQGGRNITSRHRAEWWHRLDAERDNLQAILDWSSENSDQFAEYGLRIVGALWHYWYAHGYLNEGEHWAIEMVGRAGPPQPTMVWVRALIAAGFLSWVQVEMKRGREYTEHALALAQQRGDEVTIALSMSMLGAAMAQLRNADEADRERVSALLDEALERNRKLGELWTAAFGIMIISFDSSVRGDYATGRARCEEALALFRRLGDDWGISQTLNMLGDYERIAEHYPEAQRFYEESLALYRSMGNQTDVPASLHNLGYVALHRGDMARAEWLFKESLSMQRDRGNNVGVIECLFGLAATALAAGQVGRAACLFITATHIRDELNLPIWAAERAEHERSMAQLRAKLGEGAWQQYWDSGTGLNLDQAIAYALAE